VFERLDVEPCDLLIRHQPALGPDVLESKDTEWVPL
jgi:hypothetical protein